uniref:Glutamate decarboxylase 1 n=1 Tax=Pipistrellus kuhlii TaxID=59472 RepID=A0A7J7XUC6_PIPKU|nr:glutamate decarboxylase 1 [Pipistrellus kuhlii]
MEQITLKKMREIVGWSNKDGDGIFSPGGAISNMYSIMAARYKFFPEVKTKGMAAVPNLVLFTSEHSHYSIKKAGAALGFGTDNVILIKCNERGKIIPADLEAKIIEAKQKGYVPLYVNATAGTTVYGAFDPIQEIADLCEKYNLWLHVDVSAVTHSVAQPTRWTRFCFVICLGLLPLPSGLSLHTTLAPLLSGSELAFTAGHTTGLCILWGSSTPLWPVAISWDSF